MEDLQGCLSNSEAVDTRDPGRGRAVCCKIRSQTRVAVIGRLHAHHCHQGVGGGAAREVAHHTCVQASQSEDGSEAASCGGDVDDSRAADFQESIASRGKRPSVICGHGDGVRLGLLWTLVDVVRRRKAN